MLRHFFDNFRQKNGVSLTYKAMLWFKFFQKLEHKTAIFATVFVENILKS
jgi:hypothetical protein